MGDVSLDTICRGALTLEQPTRGYRFNVDSVILADFVVRVIHPPAQQLVDLGAGCGVVGLLVARWWPGCRARLVELQPELARLARNNVARNQLDERVAVECGDLREVAGWTAPRPSVIVSNPPFHRAAGGHLSPRPQKALAKHELACTLDELVTAAARGLTEGGALARGLTEGGALVMIHAADRREEILATLEAHGFGVRHLRGVQPLPDRACTRILVHASVGSGPSVRELPPLVVEVAPGILSDEMRRVLGDGAERQAPSGSEGSTASGTDPAGALHPGRSRAHDLREEADAPRGPTSATKRDT